MSKIKRIYVGQLIVLDFQMLQVLGPLPETLLLLLLLRPDRADRRQPSRRVHVADQLVPGPVQLFEPQLGRFQSALHAGRLLHEIFPFRLLPTRQARSS